MQKLSSINDLVAECLQNEPTMWSRRLIVYELRNVANLKLEHFKSSRMSEIAQGQRVDRGS